METWTGFRSTYGACTERHLMAAGGHTWHETRRTTTVETHTDDVKNVRVLLMQARTIWYGLSKFLRQTDRQTGDGTAVCLQTHSCPFTPRYVPPYPRQMLSVASFFTLCNMQTVVVLQIAYICTRCLRWHWGVCRVQCTTHTVKTVQNNECESNGPFHKLNEHHRGVMVLACYLMLVSAR